MRALLLLSLSLATASCDPRAPALADDAPAPRPRLVVAVVIDQLPAWALDRWLPQLDRDGAVRQAIARGAFYPHMSYPYASTYTAPGHATLFTGQPPAVTGVIANSVWDRRRNCEVDTVDDGRHALLGRTDDFASPDVLRVSGVADWLSAASGGRARIAALSLKDRSAVIPGGRNPDLALWFDKTRGRFTTSTYYGARTPAWLDAWQQRHPAPSGEPADRFVADPAASELLVDLAGEAADRLELGADSVPDLLVISLSGTDYAGHLYGGRSQEYGEHLIRADRALGRLLHRLEQRTSLTVLITSDHGSTPPGRDDQQVDPATLQQRLEAAADAALGPGDWVLAVVDPYVYFTEPGRAPERRARLVAALAPALAAEPGIHATFPVTATRDPAAGDLERRVDLSIADGVGGDLYVVLQPGWVWGGGDTTPGHGTGHGNPWPSDREVPLLLYGRGVAPRVDPARHDTRQVAPTLADLLGITPPAGSLPALPH